MTQTALATAFLEQMKTAGMGGLLARYAAPVAHKATRAITQGVLQAGGIRGAVVGGALGAGKGAIQAATGDGDYQGRIARNAIGGAVLGGTLGAGVGRVRDIALTTGARGKGLAKAVGADTKRAVGDGVKRQVHGLTGWKPKGGVESIGMGGGSEARELAKVRALRDARLANATTDKAKKKIRSGAEGSIKQLTKDKALSSEMASKGLTSIPGTAQGLATSPIETGKTLLKGVKAGPGGYVGAATLPALIGAADYAEHKDVGHAVRAGTVEAGASALTGGMSLVPQAVAWGGLTSLANSGDAKKKKKLEQLAFDPRNPLT